jgi:hypothetical protein
MKNEALRRARQGAVVAGSGLTLLAACASHHDSGNFGTSDDASSDTSSGASDAGALQLGDTTTASGVCKNGMYSGTFMCTFVFDPDAGSDSGATVAADAGGLMITGTIMFTLSQMSGGNSESFMSTASGSFSGTAAMFFGIMADVGGTLDCNTGKFVGQLTNGSYMDTGPIKLFTGTFSGPLDSDYNGKTFQFVNGTWLLTVPGQGSCPGTWSASYTGP